MIYGWYKLFLFIITYKQNKALKQAQSWIALNEQSKLTDNKNHKFWEKIMILHFKVTPLTQRWGKKFKTRKSKFGVE